MVGYLFVGGSGDIGMLKEGVSVGRIFFRSVVIIIKVVIVMFVVCGEVLRLLGVLLSVLCVLVYIRNNCVRKVV